MEWLWKLAGNISLKKRIVAIFMIIIFMCGFFMFFIVKHTITQLITTNMDSAYQNVAASIMINCENTIRDMELLSQQLGYGVVCAEDLESIEDESIPVYERIQLRKSVQENIRVLSFTNSEIGLVSYDDGERVIMSNYLFDSSGDNADELNAPDVMLFQSKEISFYGPTRSFSDFTGEPVFRLRREIGNVEEKDCYLCIETNHKTMKKLIPESAEVLFVNEDGKILFGNEEIYDFIGKDWNAVRERLQECRQFIPFEAKSDKHFSVVYLVDYADFNSAKRQSYLMVIMILLVFSFVSVILAWMIWYMIYKPLKLFDRGLTEIFADKEQSHNHRTGMKEYDYLLHHIAGLKHQIVISEKEKSRLKLEKLRYQINPHFLMNTLNTIHWMAILNGQEEIDKVVQTLNRLLLYNLDKNGEKSNVEAELSAASEYMNLQQVRYDFTYDIQKIPEDRDYTYLTPKFIIQPIIENSLSHGYHENMHIHIEVRDRQETIEIIVQDNGAGMTADKADTINRRIEVITRGENNKTTRFLGIGLEYVVQTLTDFYGETDQKIEFLIQRRTSGGVRVEMQIPKIKQKEGNNYVYFHNENDNTGIYPQ